MNKSRRFCLEQCVVCVALVVLFVVVVAALAIDVRAQSASRVELASCDVSAARLRGAAPFVVAQVSDSHLNVHHRAEWTVPLERMMARVVPMLRPELQLVLHTGDVTDGRSKEVPRLSAPAPDDWREYRRLLDLHGLADPLFWLDMRGNHDVYNPPGVDLFRQFSNSGNVSAPLARAGRRYRPLSDRVAVLEIDVADGDRSFAIVLFDVCQDDPPIGTMFNFLAYADDVDVRQFAAALDELAARPNVTALFAAIHYTSNMVQPLGSLDALMRGAGVVARLSGHLHLEQLHYNSDGDMLDLELADLKEKGAFRIIAHDRGLVSFVDSHVDAPIVALVTSPKQSQYITHHDNLPAMATRDEIRLLLFGADANASVSVAIDGQTLGVAQRSNASEHFFTLPYDPRAYASGVHVLTVSVGGAGVVLDAHEFSLDGTKKALRSNVGRALTGNVAIGAALTGGFVVAVLALLALVLSPLLVRVRDDARDWQLVRMWRRAARLDVASRAYLLCVCVGCLLLPLLFSDRHGAAIFAYMLVGSRTVVGYADTHFAMLPYALFVLWPTFYLLSATALTPLFIIGAVLSSAVMVGIIVLMILQLGGVAILSSVVMYWLVGWVILGLKIWKWRHAKV